MADTILLDLKSRYRNTLVHRAEDTSRAAGKPFFDLWKPPRIKETKPPTLVRVTARYVRRPDLIAADVYGDPTLYWVIALRNGHLLPIRDLEVGKMMFVPALEDVMAGLQTSGD